MESTRFFSLSRFILLMHNDILLNYKKYLLTIAGAFILGYIFLLLQMPMRDISPDFNAQQYVSIFTLCLFGLGAFIGMSFPAFNSKADTITYLLMPSSAFEKFMSQFLIRIVAGTVLFFLIFWIDAHLARTTALFVLRKFEHIPQIDSFEFANIYRGICLNNNSLMMSATIFSFVSIGIYIFSVRMFFKKMPIVKIVISIVSLFFIAFLLMVLLSHIFYPKTVGMQLSIPEHKVVTNHSNVEIWLCSLFYWSWLFFLPLGYFKLKEKQL